MPGSFSLREKHARVWTEEMDRADLVTKDDLQAFADRLEREVRGVRNEVRQDLKELRVQAREIRVALLSLIGFMAIIGVRLFTLPL